MSGPRIRSSKPELWQSEDFYGLTPVGRLAFLALIAHADDKGRLKTNPAHLTATALHGSGIDLKVVEAAFEQMAQQGMIQSYSVNGAAYVWVVNFNKHQRIEKPTASTHPDPPPLGVLRESSGSPLVALQPDRIRSDQNGSGSGSGSGSGGANKPPLVPSDGAVEPILHWLVEHGKLDADKESVGGWLADNDEPEVEHVTAALDRAWKLGKGKSHSGKALLAYIASTASTNGAKGAGGSLLRRMQEEYR